MCGLTVSLFDNLLATKDDVGYGDLASYGHPTQEFGPIDEIAQRGIRFTQAYSADSVCSPSRASLLTGRFPVRTGAWGEQNRIWMPTSKHGLPHYEVTIAEALKEKGYTTGIVGKWHLGTNRFSHDDFSYFPSSQGFDFVGHVLPFGGSYACEGSGRYGDIDAIFCALCYGNEIVQQPYYYQNLSVTLLNDTITFIRNNKDRSFFFFYSATHNHVPMYASKSFEGSSMRGPYGDGMNELAWVVSSIVQEVRNQDIEDNTLIVFTSDNGPQLEYCEEGGDPGIFRGGKTNSFEGGYRVPLISYWPGVIEPGVSHEIFSALDLLPTFIDLAGGHLADDREYDGMNNVNALLGKGPSSRDFVMFYNRDVLFAVRFGDYKVHFFTQDDRPSQYFGRLCQPFVYPMTIFFYCDEKDVSLECVHYHDPPLIFNLQADPTESYMLDASLYTELLDRIQNLVKNHERTIVRAPPLMDENSDDTTPCCNIMEECICNWP
ncbi:arylsulfatase-like isoform X2 [Apostichopus japonicus]|uniref:arylsulfatase-like isoform X2 n=1 Tax=Stichopus japonicus TaxID=307972 RepID=UPI003AB765D5